MVDKFMKVKFQFSCQPISLLDFIICVYIQWIHTLSIHFWSFLILIFIISCTELYVSDMNIKPNYLKILLFSIVAT